MISHTNNGNTYTFVEVPKDAKVIGINKNKIIFTDKKIGYFIILPSSNYEIFCLDASKITEEQSKEMVSSVLDGNLTRYMHYGKCYPYHSLWTLQESAHSLFESLEMEVFNLLQDQNDSDCTKELCTKEEWQLAEAKVKRYVILKEVK